jgi:hypothetical protein
MLKDRRTLLFFAFVAASMCAAVVFVALLVRGDVGGPKIAMNHQLQHSQAR